MWVVYVGPFAFNEDSYFYYKDVLNPLNILCEQIWNLLREIAYHKL